jgi:hypothetical protein
MRRSDDIAARGPSGRAGFPQIRRGGLIRAPAIRLAGDASLQFSHRLAVCFPGIRLVLVQSAFATLSQHALSIEERALEGDR